MKFRKVVSEDKKRLMEISSTIWDGEDYLPHIFDAWINDTEGEFTAAELDGVVIGCAKYTKLNTREAWLEGIRGDKSYSGNGLGTKMTEYYINKAREDKMEAIKLSTFIDNYESIHVIEKLGFKKDGFFSIGYKDIKDIKELPKAENVINIMSTATAWHFISNSNFYMMSNGYVSEGWKFYKLDYEKLDKYIKENRVYGVLKEGKITAIAILTREPSNESGISIGYIDGSIEGIKALLDFSLYKSHIDKKEFISIMAALDEKLLDMLELYDFRFIAEKPREVNVFVYNYKL